MTQDEIVAKFRELEARIAALEPKQEEDSPMRDAPPPDPPAPEE